MLDETGCGGSGTHAFCCPASQVLPTCGWYTHNNGKCDNSCPSGTVEIGSNDMYCKKNYQAACCTTNTPSMKLYTKCEWGSWPVCDTQTSCPSSKPDLLASSATGTGGATCAMRVYPYPLIYAPGQGVIIFQERKFCCDASDENETFGDCKWYTSEGSAPDGAVDGWCRSACPLGRVRVALDAKYQDCLATGGARARCCQPKYGEEIDYEPPELDYYRTALEAYLRNPTCEDPSGPLKSREAPEEDLAGLLEASSLAKRAELPAVVETRELILGLLYFTHKANLREALTDLWNSEMTNLFPQMRLPSFRDFVTGEPDVKLDGPIKAVRDITCSPYTWNDRAKGSGSRLFDCTDPDCNPDTGCEEGEASVARRGLLSLPNQTAVDFTLQKRDGPPRTFKLTINFLDGTTLDNPVTLPGVCISRWIY